MNILIAPNAFKNSLDAQSVAEAIAEGLEQSKLDCHCRKFPVADGGDGTGELLIRHLNAKRLSAIVHDALGRPITAHFGLADDGHTATALRPAGHGRAAAVLTSGSIGLSDFPAPCCGGSGWGPGETIEFETRELARNTPALLRAPTSPACEPRRGWRCSTRPSLAPLARAV